VLGRILEQRGLKQQKTGINSIIRSYITSNSPDIIRMIKSRRMGWVGHITCLG
jgi:hypothetical protein